MKKVVLELGGSDPFILLENSDLETAVEVALKSRILNNAGQVCFSAKRFLVPEKIKQPFIQLLIPKLQNLKIGDPRNKDTQLGPLARKDILEKALDQI